ncbi:MAG: glycosyltransferase 2 family protein [Frankiaceae bacterium]|jgi:undecaprenyl-diphosphatase|nr:glycosyltransferase 2 family protein [Frankiaceae bacterium]
MTGAGPPGPRLRSSLVWAPFALTSVAVRRHEIAAWEARVSRRLNNLPAGLRLPMWAVMQTGAFASPLVLGGAALAAGRPTLARGLLESGLGAYFAAKAVKRAVGRARPTHFLPATLIRGRAQTGDGYVSGHAAVSMALAVEAHRHLGRRSWPLVVVVAPAVGIARIYVGAHLPLDVVGGLSLGWAIAHR